MSQTNAKKVQTVLGPVDAGALGITLAHEHFLIDMTPYFVPPPEAEKELSRQRVTLENLWWVRLKPPSNLDNLKLDDEKLVLKEALFYKKAGGKTLVEVSTPPVGRNPAGLARLAKATGLNVVMGAGFHTARSHPAWVAARSEKEITGDLVKDITVGVDGVRAGIIGEIGCSAPLAEAEKKVLRCCAAAAKETGVAISIHSGPKNEVGLEIARILKDSGAAPDRTVIGHMDISGYNLDTCRKLMDGGCFIAFDTFGFEGFITPPHESFVLALNDEKRLNDIQKLIAEGYLEKILISQDVATRERLCAYAGTGYAHILRDVVPVMRIKGFTEAQINALLVANPARMLCS